MDTQAIAVTMGDPASIGPEIVAKAICSERVAGQVSVVVVGDGEAMRRAVRDVGLDVQVRCIESPAQVDCQHGVLHLIDLNNAPVADYQVGEMSALCGRASYEYICRSAELAMKGEVAAVVTAPICKESLRMADVDYIGHTEIYAGITGVQDPLTMFEVDALRIFFLTRHLSLRGAIERVSAERIVDYVARSTKALHQLGIRQGTMAVAGLNPHNGEQGSFGDEEIRHIIPAVEQLQAMGYDVCGPVAADSVFHLALQGRYSAVLSLYHDQGHIAAKTYDFERTISLTLGLPFLRTSVDHGTAFDISGKGIASEVSMIEAILLAEKYGPIYQRNVLEEREGV